MDTAFGEYLNSKIEEMVANLRKNNSEHALAVEKEKILLENINPILCRDRGVTISAGDCADMRGCLEQEFVQTAIIQQELYKQGYFDCVKLFRTLGVIR